ncbi:ABC transporter ATP-binding protein [Rhodococcus rhodochrous]|uniref:ABC transporter ATP-binding protein n=1 Tax=Rhodococcus rhodochrous TaxID=1829 RepID=UPI000AB71C59|nr:ABC transporter ATP-binding protein [Rhodococcus rhodochrous]
MSRASLLSTKARGHASATSAPQDRNDSHAAQGVSVQDVVKEYRSKKSAVRALDRVSLHVAPGEMAVLLGPSGCGKTTLLRSIAGLEQPQAGEIRIGNRTVYSAATKTLIPPERRALSMVFQSYALWPHMTVFENIAFPLRCRKPPKDQLASRVRRVMEAVDLGRFGERYPSQLSGGQQQRVALARAIVADVDVILFDEPLSNVDAKVREEVRKEIIELQETFGFAGVYVTHDQIEAGAMAKQLVVMNHGVIAQSGKPQDLYDRPDTLYVAQFMGTVAELPGTVEETTGDTVVDTALGKVVGHSSTMVVSGQQATAVFRPEWAHISPDPISADHNVWSCTVKHKMFMGSAMELVVEIESTVSSRTAEALVRVPRGSGYREGQELSLHVPSDAMRIVAE